MDVSFLVSAAARSRRHLRRQSAAAARYSAPYDRTGAVRVLWVVSAPRAPHTRRMKETSVNRTRVLVLGGAALLAAVAWTPHAGVAAAQQPPDAEQSSATLVDKVRTATAIFRDINQATGYEPFGGCVSGPEDGAMGVHFVNQQFLRDGEIAVDKPEALIYEFKNGRARLVGVEFIVDAEQWDTAHPEPPVPPVLEGQLFHFNESPNRFRLRPFYELHVWAWRDNPNGAFVDWNPRVSCEGQ
jgi:hypothetical protein